MGDPRWRELGRIDRDQDADRDRERGGDADDDRAAHYRVGNAPGGIAKEPGRSAEEVPAERPHPLEEDRADDEDQDRDGEQGGDRGGEADETVEAVAPLQ